MSFNWLYVAHTRRMRDVFIAVMRYAISAPSVLKMFFIIQHWLMGPPSVRPSVCLPVRKLSFDWVPFSEHFMQLIH